MKLKKVLAGALALVMAVGTILVAPVESKADPSTVADIDCTGWWAAHTDGIEIEEGKDYVITFDTKRYETATLNWNAPLYVVYTGAEARVGCTDYAEYWVCRSDNYGWIGGKNTSPESSLPEGYAFETLAADWDNYPAKIAAGTTGSLVVEYDNGVAVATFSVGGVVSKTTIPVNAAKPLYISLTGELCTVTNVQYGTPGYVSITDLTVPVAIDATATLEANLVAVEGALANNNIVWSSSNEAIATVSDAGVVTGVATGEVTITAKSAADETIYDTTTVTIVDGLNKVTGIELTAPSATVKLGATAQLTTAVTLENPNKEATDDTTVTYTTSDADVVTVNAEGLVTAVGLGTATITATVGEFTDTVEITVPAVPATKLEASVEKTELNAGDSVQIKATVAPTDTTDVITYESSNGAVLVVDANGKVSAVKAGTATVTVKAGSLTKTFNFAVNETSTMELDDMSIEGWWTAHTPGIAIEAGKTYTFTFDAKSKAATEAYFCPSYVVYSNSAAAVQNDSADYKEYYVCRADNFSWSPAGNSFDGKLGDGYVLETNAIPETTDWLATYKENMAAGAKATITAVLSGSNLIVVYDVAGVKTTSTIPVDASKPLYIGLTGEQVDVTNLVVTSQTAIKATADILPVLPIVMLIVGCGVVVVASKKRFAK